MTRAQRLESGKLNDLELRVRDLATQGVEFGQMKERLGIPRSSLQYILESLIAAKFIERVGLGKYRACA